MKVAPWHRLDVQTLCTAIFNRIDEMMGHTFPKLALAGVLGIFGCAVAATLVDIVAFSRHSDLRSADAAIVLGAAVFDRVPSPVFEERIRHAVALYRAGRVRLLVMTGGIGDGDGLSEAEAARDWSIAHGVPPSAILVETQSRTTRENLAFVSPLLRENDVERVLLVSDPLHMRRAIALAHRLDVNAAPSPTPSTRYIGWRSWTGFLLSEAYYLTRCRLSRDC